MSLATPLTRIDESPYYAPPREALWIARLALVAAAGISGYLLYTTWTGSAVAGCGEGSACDTVLSSQYSQWFGIPVSLLAIVLDLVALVALAMVGRRRSADSQRDAWRLVIVLSAAITAAAAWFVGVQIYLQAICPWCMAAHGCGLTAAAVAFLFGPMRSQPAGIESRVAVRPMRLRTGLALSMMGAASVAALAAGQVFGPPPTRWEIRDLALTGPTTSAKPIGDSSRDAAEEKPSLTGAAELDGPASPKGRVVEPAVATADGTQDPPPEIKPSPDQESGASSGAAADKTSAEPAKTAGEVRPITSIDIELPKIIDDVPANPADPFAPVSDEWDPQPVHQNFAMGKRGHAIDLIDFPVIGSRKARFIAVEFFDYTCSHCRSLHQSLELARGRYGSGQFALAMVPVPMSRQCNEFVTTDNPQHKESCRYAMLALGVWKTDPKEFAAFHDYLMGGTQIPTLDEAYLRATTAVDETKLKLALEDKWIKVRIVENTKMYKMAGAGKIPKLMCGPYLVVGEPASDQELFGFLENRWGLRPRETPKNDKKEKP